MRNDQRDSGAEAGVPASVFQSAMTMLLRRARRARWCRRSRAEKLRDIQSITDAALSMLDPRALLDALVDRAKEALQADTSAMLLLDRRPASRWRRRRAGWKKRSSRGSGYVGKGSPGGSRRKAAR